MVKVRFYNMLGPLAGGLSQILSALLQPLYMPAYGAIGIFWALSDTNTTPDWGWQARMVLLLWLSYGLLPGLVLLWMKQLRYIDSLRIRQRHRSWLFPIMALFFLTETLVFSYLPIPEELLSYLWSSCMLLALLWLFNFMAKVSAHSAAIGHLSGYCLGLWIHTAEERLLLFACGGLLCCGMLMSARLHLGAHNEKEVYAGSSIGFLGGLSSYILLELL